MNNRAKINLPDILSAVLIIVTAMSLTACLFLLSKPFREKGSAPSLAGVAQAAQGEQPWNGSFVNFLICGINPADSRTDVIMLVGFNNKTGGISILQIPGDTFAGGSVPTHMYSAVYGDHAKGVSGMENLKAHVERDFGVTVDYYAAVTLGGLRSLVDAAGGVNLDVPSAMDYDDPAQGLHIHLKSGYQRLSGSGAEQFVRYGGGLPGGELGRLGAQRSFLAAFTQKLKGMSAVTLSTKILPSLMPPNFTTDMDTLELIRFALAVKKIDLSRITVETMPGKMADYEGEQLYSAQKSALLPILNGAFMPQGRALKPGDIKLGVLPGGGSVYAGGAESFESLLRAAS